MLTVSGTIRQCYTRALHTSRRSLVRSLTSASMAPSEIINTDSSHPHMTKLNTDTKQLQSTLSLTSSSSERSSLADKVIRSLSPANTNTNKDMLQLALQHLEYNKVTSEAIQNIITIINSTKSTNSLGTDVTKSITDLLVAIYHKDPSLIELLETSVGRESSTQAARTILSTFYIRTNQLTKAYQWFKIIDSSGLKIDSTALELLIIHLCHQEKLTEAAILLKRATATSKNYTIYPRTYTEFLSKAISMGSRGVCEHNYKLVLSHSYISNEMLVSLAELLSTRIPCSEMAELLKIASLKQSMTPDLRARMKIAMTENFAIGQSYTRAFKYMETTYSQNTVLRVDDHPVLLSKFVVGENEEKAIKTRLRRIMFDQKRELKQFEIALMMAKLVQQNRLSFGLKLLKDNPALNALVNADCLNQLIKGLKSTTSDGDFDSFVEVFLNSDKTLRTRWAVVSLTNSLVNSKFWFRLFKVIPYISIEGFKLSEPTQTKLKELCDQNEYGKAAWDSIPKAWLSHEP